jgi:iron complex outermembrane receptor protein
VPGLAAPATAPARPVIVTAMADQPAGAQPGDQATPPSEADAAQNEGDIVVTGFRASLQSAVNQRRRSDQIIDAITAEDIADFPDANVAESIQRLPGVSIDRDNG